MEKLRKSFLVKPRLQFKYFAGALFMTAVSSLAVYLTVRETLLTSDLAATLTPMQFDELDFKLRAAFLWVAFLLLLAFGVENILRFHRIVGPIFVLERSIKNIAAGDLTQNITLRRHDELKDFVHELTAMKEGLIHLVKKDRQAARRSIERLETLSRALDSLPAANGYKKEIGEIQKELEKLTSEFNIGNE